MSRPVKIIDWASVEDLDKKIEERKNYTNALSPFNRDYYTADLMQFAPYVNECGLDEFHEDALIKELIEKGYVICGDTHQFKAIPVFEDGYLLLSMRRWADIMQKAWREKYMTSPNFYIASLCNQEEKLPNE